MYSVLIQNAATQKEFSRFQPLFAEALSSNQIGICRWNESGTTVDTALPELKSLTDDKEEWRAIIIRYLDEPSMARCAFVPSNPYDFLENQTHTDAVRESTIPLVRMTQLLGGIPPLEVKFEAQLLREERRKPRTIYVPVDDPERDQAYEALTRKYRFDGKKPSAILIISIRRDANPSDENIGRAWRSHKESESSEFWKRNGYPSLCRFLVYDFASLGPVQRDADAFNFWLSVFLLATNEVDSSTLQAYRLYTLKTEIDRPALSEFFQDTADKLRDAKTAIEREIQEELQNGGEVDAALPSYRVAVPVSLKLPPAEEHEVEPELFPALSAGAATDLGNWNRRTAEVETSLENVVRSAGRSLDQAADRMRGNCSFQEEEVEPLSRYQEEDLLRETDGFYQDIVRLQAELPSESVSKNAALVGASENVREELHSRILKKPAWLVFWLVAALLLLCAVPAAIHLFGERFPSSFSRARAAGELAEAVPLFAAQHLDEYMPSASEAEVLSDPVQILDAMMDWDEEKIAVVTDYLSYFSDGALDGEADARALLKKIDRLDPQRATYYEQQDQLMAKLLQGGIILGVFLAATLLVGLAALIVVLIFKNRLRKKVGAYNQEADALYNKVVESSEDYSNFMGAIASHARGRSYYSISSQKKQLVTDLHGIRYKHTKAIGILLSKIKKWSRAYHLDVDFSAQRPYSRVNIDTAIPPQDNKYYSFGRGDSYPLVVNHSGIQMQSPFAFVRGIEIEREELYDDP